MCIFLHHTTLHSVWGGFVIWKCVLVDMLITQVPRGVDICSDIIMVQVQPGPECRFSVLPNTQTRGALDNNKSYMRPSDPPAYYMIRCCAVSRDMCCAVSRDMCGAVSRDMCCAVSRDMCCAVSIDMCCAVSRDMCCAVSRNMCGAQISPLCSYMAFLVFQMRPTCSTFNDTSRELPKRVWTIRKRVQSVLWVDEVIVGFTAPSYSLLL